MPTLGPARYQIVFVFGCIVWWSLAVSAQNGIPQSVYKEQITLELQKQLQDVTAARAVRNGAELANALLDPSCAAAVFQSRATQPFRIKISMAGRRPSCYSGTLR